MRITKEQLSARIEELEKCLEEAVYLMEDVKLGAYKPDSFTTQPWRVALKMPLED